jgi:hypothetical protein
MADADLLFEVRTRTRFARADAVTSSGTSRTSRAARRGATA